MASERGNHGTKPVHQVVQLAWQADPLDGSGAADASDGWHEPDRLAAPPDDMIVTTVRAPKNQSRIVEHLRTVLLAPERVRPRE
jgi:hypothetical protein